MDNKFLLISFLYVLIICAQIFSMEERSIPAGSPYWTQSNTGNDSEMTSSKRKSNSCQVQKKTVKKDEECPLHNLAFDGHDRKIIYYLEKYEYDVDILDKNGRTPLYWAVLGRKIMTIKLLLERGANINLIFPAVEKFLEKPNYGEVKSILLHAKKGDLNQQNFEQIIASFVSNTSLLFNLAKKGEHQEIAKYLNSQNVNIEDSNGKTPLYYAISRKKFITARVLLEHGADFDKIKKFSEIEASNLQEYKNSVLFELVKRIDPEELKYYITEQNINMTDLHGKTPLYYAVLVYVRLAQLPDADENKTRTQQALLSIEILLAHGADYKPLARFKEIRQYMIDSESKSEKQYEKLERLLDLFKLSKEKLSENTDSITSLNAAIETNDPALVERYFNEMEWSEADISTSLLYAIQILDPENEVRNFRMNGQSDYNRELYVQNLVQIINFLFSRQPALRAYVNNGKNFLHLAIRKARTCPEIIHCLIENGVDDDAQDNLGQTPLDFLMNLGAAKLRTIETLMQYKSANFMKNYRTNNGKNLLHKAIEWNLSAEKIEEWVGLLNGNGVFETDNNGITPFDLALNQRNWEALRIFERYADRNFLSHYRNNGRNLIHLGVEGGVDAARLREIIRFFERDAIEDTDNDGLTPLALAIQTHNVEAIKVLREFKANENIKLNINGEKKKIYDLARENDVEEHFPSIAKRKFISKLGIILAGSLSAYLVMNQLIKDYRTRNNYV